MPDNSLELLAPAGKMDVLKSVVKAGADAVYLGGKRFNMRMLRTEFNFSDEELGIATDYIHERNKKIYITLNNLYDDEEIEQIGEYLIFLNGLGVDALIIQDLGILQLCEELNIKIPLHASVQMGIANSEAVKWLAEKNIKRVILSKNLSLTEIRDIYENTNMGIEYFVHGDLCVSHTGQCYMSAFVSGESGNRGKCLKPCRWQYELCGEKDGQYNGYQYFLAHKDLCLYPHLHELIGAGVTSFKIEGRMRTAEYVSYLVSKYRHALNNIIDNPQDYHMDENEYNDLIDK